MTDIRHVEKKEPRTTGLRGFSNTKLKANTFAWFEAKSELDLSKGNGEKVPVTKKDFGHVIEVLNQFGASTNQEKVIGVSITPTGADLLDRESCEFYALGARIKPAAAICDLLKVEGKFHIIWVRHRDSLWALSKAICKSLKCDAHSLRKWLGGSVKVVPSTKGEEAWAECLNPKEGVVFAYSKTNEKFICKAGIQVDAAEQWEGPDQFTFYHPKQSSTVCLYVTQMGRSYVESVATALLGKYAPSPHVSYLGALAGSVDKQDWQEPDDVLTSTDGNWVHEDRPPRQGELAALYCTVKDTGYYCLSVCLTNYSALKQEIEMKNKVSVAGVSVQTSLGTIFKISIRSKLADNFQIVTAMA